MDYERGRSGGSTTACALDRVTIPFEDSVLPESEEEVDEGTTVSRSPLFADLSRGYIRMGVERTRRKLLRER